MSRTDAIARAIVEALQQRRDYIDANDDLISVSLAVKLNRQPTNELIRVVSYEDQTASRRQMRGA